MKFTHPDPIKWYRGYEFVRGRPTNVTDDYTINVLLHDPSFQQVKEIKDEKKVQEAAKEVLTPQGKPCSKCGRVIRQGLFVHEKYCKGAQ